MSLIIAGKSDLGHLFLFGKNDFPSYELYLGLFDKEEINQKLMDLPDYIKISSIHNPARVKVGGKIYSFDLSEPGEIGEESLKSLKGTIRLAKTVEAKRAIIHGATYNPFKQSREEALNLLAMRIKSLFNGGISFSFETDALWHNLFYQRRALLTSAEDFLELDSILQGKLKITADIEHLYLTFYFNKFINHLRGEKEFLSQFSEKKANSFEEKITSYIKNNFPALEKEAQIYLTFFLNKFKDKIEQIHLCGSDCFNLRFNPETKLPLEGEHLPLGFDKKGIKDRLDYLFLTDLFEILPKEKEIPLVLEIRRKDLTEFIAETKRSKQFLINYLNEKVNK
ncbi:MAG: hypothetical protein AB1668_00390 [Nanoarchaeota archaeon]